MSSLDNRTRAILLLGPQTHEPTLSRVFPSAAIPEGPIALVTAGWQEREGEDEELDRQLGGRSLDLELYRRADRVFRSDPDFTQAHREMQRRLRELTRIYDSRLSFLRASTVWLLEQKGEDALLDPEREHSISQMQELDSWHLRRIVEIRGEFEDRYRPLERASIAREREEIANILNDAPAVVIAGGHVAVLLNRMRLFGVADLVSEKDVIAWSAGAMVLTERVVLFHDHPPQGAGNAGVMEKGLGLCSRLVALPDGRKRLALGSPVRVSMFARRFAPDPCIVLGEGDCIRWDGREWTSDPPASRLGLDGALHEVSRW